MERVKGGKKNQFIDLEMSLLRHLSEETNALSPLDEIEDPERNVKGVMEVIKRWESVDIEVDDEGFQLFFPEINTRVSFDWRKKKLSIGLLSGEKKGRPTSIEFQPISHIKALSSEELSFLSVFGPLGKFRVVISEDKVIEVTAKLNSSHL